MVLVAVLAQCIKCIYYQSGKRELLSLVRLSVIELGAPDSKVT
jgi:hypothetical protein